MLQEKMLSFGEFRITLWHIMLMVRGARDPAMWTAVLQKEEADPWIPIYMLLDSDETADEQLCSSWSLFSFQAAQTMNAIESMLGWPAFPACEKTGNKHQALRLHLEVTGCQGRCSYEIRNEVWPKYFFVTVKMPAKPINTMLHGLAQPYSQCSS